MSPLQQLESFLSEEAGCGAGCDGIVVAFSGGADSTALLWGLGQIAPRLGTGLVAAHLDHALDPGSRQRCEQARQIAARLAVPFVSARRPVQVGGGSRGVEAEARSIRYAFLEEVRREAGFAFIATAHHRDDQAETVLLRMQFGSGPLGLAGIRRRDGNLLRPLLGCSRRELQSMAARAGVEWVEDPTNRDLGRPRNRIRHRTLATLADDTDDLVGRLERLARTASGARRSTRRRLRALLAPITTDNGTVAAPLAALARLPDELLAPATALLHDLAGASYPPPARAVAELRRQMAAKRRIGCDCGAFWRWEARGEHLHVLRREPRPPLFTYTLKLLGEDSSALSPE